MDSKEEREFCCYISLSFQPAPQAPTPNAPFLKPLLSPCLYYVVSYTNAGNGAVVAGGDVPFYFNRSFGEALIHS